ncbi:MAG: iron-sulfur cluster assembly accessory protein [Pirellulales bacterium]|nr:iron-sulfur cluster assembly accessory protein [Pirellulales bacterium]
MAITITEAAANEVKRHMETQGLDSDMAVRLSVAGGGCSGLQYSLGFDNAFDQEEDTASDHHGVRLVTRKKFALHLDGTTVDFIDGPMGKGFSITNPNYASGGCPGCGGHG